MSVMRTGVLMAIAALGGLGCDGSDGSAATSVGRVEIMNLAVAQQVNAPALAAVFPATRTRDRQIQNEPYAFTTSEFDPEGRLLRIAMTDLQIQAEPYRIVTVEWVEDVVSRVSVVDALLSEEPHYEAVTDGL